jgi:hypothetical protein
MTLAAEAPGPALFLPHIYSVSAEICEICAQPHEGAVHVAPSLSLPV